MLLVLCFWVSLKVNGPDFISNNVQHLEIRHESQQLLYVKSVFSWETVRKLCWSFWNQTSRALWALRSRCTWQWVSVRHRPCVRPGPSRTSWAQRLWCRCNGRTGTWGTSGEGRSLAPAGGPYTTERARPAGRGWGPPSCWAKQHGGFKSTYD